MALSIRVYGSVDSFPPIDEIIEALEESDFEVTVETEDDDEDDWSELLVFESSLDGPIKLFRYSDMDEVKEEIEGVLDSLDGYRNSEGGKILLGAFDNCVLCFGIEVPEEMDEDDDALLLCDRLALLLTQRCDGIYSIDSEGFFDDSGELILELA